MALFWRPGFDSRPGYTVFTQQNYEEKLKTFPVDKIRIIF
jgi:hypothetical protein